MGRKNPSGQGDDHHAGDDLLKIIADRERELETQAASARDEAAAAVAQARAQAEQIARDARLEAARLAEESARRIADDVRRIEHEAQATALREIERLRAQAAARREAAAADVVERVIAGGE